MKREELERRLSPAAFEELVHVCGGEVLRVPARSYLKRRHRHAHVVQLLGADSTYNEVAAVVHADVSTVVRDGKRAG